MGRQYWRVQELLAEKDGYDGSSLGTGMVYGLMHLPYRTEKSGYANIGLRDFLSEMKEAESNRVVEAMHLFRTASIARGV